MQPQESNSESFELLVGQVKKGTRLVNLGGLTSTAAKAFLITKLKAATGKTIAVVTANNVELDAWESDLSFWQSHHEFLAYAGDAESNVILPSFETDVYAGVSPHAETLEKRALALWNLARGDFGFVVLSARALATRVFTKERILRTGALLKRDNDFEPGLLIRKLSACGYKREEPIANIGEYSVRGGIVDVWPPNSELPFR
ncbi:MAG: hypothetical protein OEM82_15845, partial [Acidobacteriota bacterium]|nr:hypothetical protein [Acidobacteriota bacterium]